MYKEDLERIAGYNQDNIALDELSDILHCIRRQEKISDYKMRKALSVTKVQMHCAMVFNALIEAIYEKDLEANLEFKSIKVISATTTEDELCDILPDYSVSKIRSLLGIYDVSSLVSTSNLVSIPPLPMVEFNVNFMLGKLSRVLTIAEMNKVLSLFIILASRAVKK